MASFEILDGFASVLSNRRTQRDGRRWMIGLGAATVLLAGTGFLLTSRPGLGAALVTGSVLTLTGALVVAQRVIHTKPIEGIDLQTGHIDVAADAITISHPMLRTPLVLARSDVRAVSVETDPSPDLYSRPVERFPVTRHPGVGYRLWEPHVLLSTRATETAQPNIVLLHLSLDDPVRPTYPNVAIVFREPITLAAALGDHDRVAPGAFDHLPRRRTERELAAQRNRTWGTTTTPGVYLRVADPHRLRLALLELGVREGIDADDVPGAPPHLPLPPPGTS